MTFADLEIPGVAGTVSVEYGFWSGYKFAVDGERLKPHGFPRTRLTLPGIDRPVEARIRGGLLRAYPALSVDGVEYPTGPPTPRTQQVVALLPLIGLLLVQGALGFLMAFGGTAANLSIVRSDRPNSTKLALMIATLVVVVVVDLVVAVTLTSSIGH